MEREHGLGRLPAPDPRDQNFPMRAILREPSPRYARYWSDNGAWLNQGPKPHCVEYAWRHCIADGPITHPGPDPVDQAPFGSIYSAAQKIDEWPGEGYDGTSVRAGAKILQDMGVLANYWWAASVDDIVQAILEHGPVVVGFSWMEGMDHPVKGFLHAEGRVLGGHAFVLNGVNTRTGFFRMKNSWGREWSNRGRGWLSIADVTTLLKDGEACIPTEVSP